MRLLLDGADEGEHRRNGADGDLIARSGDERSGTVAVVLDHAVGRDRQPERLQHVLRDPRVLDAAVDEQHVRALCEARILLDIVRQPPQQDLMHGRVVVLIGQALDLEALIGRFERLSILKDDHGGDNIRPGQVGDVVGFHPVRGIRQVEHIGQHAERAGAALRLGGDALGFFAGVFLRQLDQTDVVAALRHTDEDLLAQLLLQKCGEQLRVLHLKRRQNDLGRRAADEIKLLDKRRDGLLRIIRRRKDLVFLIEQASVYIMQDCKAGPRFVLIVADDVGVGHRPGRDELLFAKGFHGPQPVAQRRRQLKLQLVRRGLHLHAQLARHLLVVPLQDEDGLLHPGVVVLLAARELAPAVAVVHVVIQAGALLAEVARELLGAAGQLERQPQRIDHMLRHEAAAEGTKVAGLVAGNAADHLHGGIVLRQIDAQIRVALVILQEDVVLGHVPLDERAFEHERLKFRPGDDGVEMVDLRDHLPRLRRMGGRILKILADTVFELLRLADVDDRAGLVLHQVHARLVGQRERLVFEFFKCHTNKKSAADATPANQIQSTWTGGAAPLLSVPDEKCSENLFYEHIGQCLDCFFLIGALSNDADARALGDAHGQNAEQALGVDLAVFHLDPDAGLELVGLLDEVGSLTVIKAGFALYDGLLHVHRRHSLYIMLGCPMYKAGHSLSSF